MPTTTLHVLTLYHITISKDGATKYFQYEDNIGLVLLEINEILEKLKADKSGDGQFNLFYRSVPSYVSAVLLRDYFDKLQY